jgi:hypothetical protein
MLIVATGLEYSGTGWLSEILRTSGEQVLHRAMPHVNNVGSEIWWWPRRAYTDVNLFVRIVRDEHYRRQAALRRGWLEDEIEVRRRRGEFYFAGLPENTQVVHYEDLVRNPVDEIRNLSLAINLPLYVLTQAVDGNSKYDVEEGTSG